jgi:hypothetical protein
MKYYHKLGKLPKDTIDFFLDEILKRKVPNVPYQWILFDKFLNEEFLKIFSNSELKIQWNKGKIHPIQKVFYSEPNHGFRIHKDGLFCKSAMNTVLSCNNNDWVRWYDEDYINSIASVITSTNIITNNYGNSRDVNIAEYETVKFTEELHTEVGDVYTLDVDTYHSFKCIGTNPRIILQTKFENFPEFETITESLIKNSFSNLVKL